MTEAREAAHAAYIDATTLGEHPLDRVNAVFDAVIASLRYHGVLPKDDPQPTTAHLDETARFLANASGFPRYTDGDGWTYLRAYESDVRCAYRKATENLRPGQDGLAVDLALAQQRLLDHLEEASS